MQRRRGILKIQKDIKNVQEQNEIHNANVHRRNIGRRFTRTATVQPATKNNIHKHNPLNNSAPPIRENFNFSFVDNLWEGETAYIIGGGPSLQGFDFSKLIGSNVIAINKAIYSFPAAQILYWTDNRFYTWYKNDIDNFGCLKYTIKTGSLYADDIKILRKGAVHGLEEPKDTLAHGNNSGYAAINLAYHLGAKRIVLLGFDMANDGDLTHYHDGYPTQGTANNVYHDKFLPGFKSLASGLRKKQIQVFNASVYSKLQDFPKISLEAALSFR